MQHHAFMCPSAPGMMLTRSMPCFHGTVFTKPLTLQLLGKDLVAWRNKEGRWTCFDDRCPHRAAPLTEGRVDEKDGNLM